MANSWLRLWHDMPNDPKFRTVAKVAQRPLPFVISVYVHLLVSGSTSEERGSVAGVNCEDVASAIDVEVEDVAEIMQAMQGRLIVDGRLTGWEKRQPAREDGSAERAKEWRRAHPQHGERTRTLPNAEKRPDTDKDTDVKTPQPPSREGGKKPTRAERKSAAANVGAFPSTMTAEQEREMQLDVWRSQRNKGSPLYAKEAPRWAQEILEREGVNA